MKCFELLADALDYPLDYPEGSWLERLEQGCAALPQGPIRKGISAFLGRLEPLSVSEREELYTRTFDLNPTATPYLGYVIFGDSYQRGELMAALNRAQDELGVDGGGELPDHLRPVLRYLARADAPLPELLEILGPALKKIHKSLKTIDAHNPYLDLLGTTERALARLEVPQGGAG